MARSRGGFGRSWRSRRPPDLVTFLSRLDRRRWQMFRFVASMSIRCHVLLSLGRDAQFDPGTFEA